MFSLSPGQRPWAGRLSVAGLALFVSSTALAATCGLLMLLSEFAPSIATETQLRTLLEQIYPRVTRIGDKNETLIELNALLKPMNLPTIDLESAELVVIPAHFKGTVSGERVGFEVRDGRHRFCLPCSPRHNGFRYSIEPM